MNGVCNNCNSPSVTILYGTSSDWKTCIEVDDSTRDVGVDLCNTCSCFLKHANKSIEEGHDKDEVYASARMMLSIFKHGNPHV